MQFSLPVFVVQTLDTTNISSLGRPHCFTAMPTPFSLLKRINMDIQQSHPKWQMSIFIYVWQNTVWATDDLNWARNSAYLKNMKAFHWNSLVELSSINESMSCLDGMQYLSTRNVIWHLVSPIAIHRHNNIIIQFNSGWKTCGNANTSHYLKLEKTLRRSETKTLAIK